MEDEHGNILSLHMHYKRHDPVKKKNEVVTGVLSQATAAAAAAVRILKCDWQGKPKDKG